jgi:hypothetical protein
MDQVMAIASANPDDDSLSLVIGGQSPAVGIDFGDVTADQASFRARNHARIGGMGTDRAAWRQRHSPGHPPVRTIQPTSVKTAWLSELAAKASASARLPSARLLSLSQRHHGVGAAGAWCNWARLARGAPWSGRLEV